jgi:hypothetical protein
MDRPLGEPQSPNRLAQPGVGSITAIYQHNPSGQIGLAGRPDLIQGNLRLGQKTDPFGDARSGARAASAVHSSGRYRRQATGRLAA